ncbi:MAG: 3-phosphoshikimate 1-carboxyvinyltransferase [Oscillospiraceae bacterium]|nr:3-phosphoshikimate 1-carboxyvinyltransferase [Oscillospiraceae bacterium]
MIAEIRPGKGKGTMEAPPSKSMAHRLLICGGLSEGKSVIKGISSSEDMKATLDCLSAIGAKYEIEGDTVTITGADIRNIPEGAVLKCRESGSTLRFFIPICLLDGKTFTLTGSEKLLSRPLSVYEDIFKKQGITFEAEPDKIKVGGRLNSGNYKIKGNISSQFITGLLFVLPLMEKDSVIQLIPPVESLSYINLTIEALSVFGIRIEWQDEKTLFIKGGQSYKAANARVEGDYSNAAFFAALNDLGSEIEMTGLNPKSLQGDKVYEKNFALLGKGTPTINISDCPDLGPILFAVAAVKGGGVFTGTRRLKIKESDRASAMAEELSKFGVAVTVHEDSVVVYPHDFHAPTEILCGHNDHRIVMSCAVLLTLTGGKIEGAEASRKSLPDFFERLEKLGFEVDLYDA